MIQLIIALLISLGQISSEAEWSQLSPTEQTQLIIDVDTLGL